jgi:hypothetical protein
VTMTTRTVMLAYAATCLLATVLAVGLYLTH